MMAEAEPLNASTKLALDRTRLAHERTLMAWVRTAASLISFGFTIYKFLQYLHQQNKSQVPEGFLGPRTFGMLMIGIGLIALAIATVQNRREMQDLRSQYGQLPLSLAGFVAGLVAVLGLFSMTVLVLRQ
jgi:putative membrane protein